MWINIMPFQEFHTNAYGKTKHDKTLAEKIVQNFEKNITGYPVPLLVSHSEQSGKLGEFKSLQTKDDGLYADVELNDKGKKILNGSQFDFVSPAYAERYKDKTTGADAGATLLEVSLTNKPGQPNMEKLRFEDEAESIQIYNLKRGESKMEKEVLKMYKEQSAAKQEEIKKLTDELETNKEKIKKLTDTVDEKEQEIKKLSEQVEKANEEKRQQEIDTWAKEWSDKGKAPAVVKKFKEQLLNKEVKKEFADSVLEDIPSINDGGKEVPNEKQYTETYDEIAKKMTEVR